MAEEEIDRSAVNLNSHQHNRC